VNNPLREDEKQPSKNKSNMVYIVSYPNFLLQRNFSRVVFGGFGHFNCQKPSFIVV
jgi:hypothetical protein